MNNLLSTFRSLIFFLTLLFVTSISLITLAQSTIRFAAFGDYGDNDWQEQAVADLVNSLNPDFILTLGDNSYDDTDIDTNIGKYYSDYIGDYQGTFGPGSPTNRFFPTIGNHDINDGGGLPAYLAYFTLPGDGIPTSNTSGNERYYDFIRGPVHFFVLNNDPQEPDGNESNSIQGQWLQAQLAASTAPWKIVTPHRPPYSSGERHGSDPEAQWPYEEWGATATMSGHEHSYERILRDDNNDGVDFVYFVAGLGGRSIHNFPSSGFVQGSQVRYNDNFGAMLITASASEITFEFWSIENGGTLIDSYTIQGTAQPEPDISVTPASHNFGNVFVGSSSTETFEILNDGNEDLNVSATTLTGGNSSHFTIESGGGSFTLNPGESRNLQVSFNPTSNGSKNTTLRIRSNDPDEDPFNVPLTGEAVPPPEPDITATPNHLNYGYVVLNTSFSKVLQIRNDGGEDLEVNATSLSGGNAAVFNIESGGAPFTLSTGESQDILITFSPASAGVKSAILRIESNDPDEDPLDIPLNGSAVSTPPDNVVFEEAVGGSASNSSAVTTSGNLTGANDHLYLAVISSKPYQPTTSVSGLSLNWTLLQSQCSGRDQTGVDIWMAQGMATAGQVTAVLSGAALNAVISVARYSGVDETNPVGNLLSGNTNGIGGDCSGGSDTDFYSFNFTTTVDGTVVFGAAAMRNENHNPGNGYTERDEIHQGSGGNVASLAIQDKGIAGASTIDLNGSFSGITDWAIVGVEVKPSGIVPDIAVEPVSYDFGDVDVTMSASKNFEVRNEGPADLEVNAITLDGTNAGEFNIENNPAPFTLALGESENVVVSFNPVSTGSKNATLRIASNDPENNPFDVSLSGAGVERPPVWSIPGTLEFPEDSSLAIDLDSLLTDENDPNSALTITYQAGANVSVSLDSVSHLATFNAPLNFYGTDATIFTAIDPLGLSANDTVTILVTPVNDPPLVSLPLFEFNEDSTYTVDLDTLVIDIDHDTSEISWSFAFPAGMSTTIARQWKAPSGQLNLNINNRGIRMGDNDSLMIEIDTLTHLTTITATPNFYGLDIPVMFTAVDDSGAGDSDTTMISIFPVNDPPVIATSLPGAVFNEDDTLIYAISQWYPFVNDPDHLNEQLSYWLASGQYVNADSGAGGYTLTALENWFGSDTLQLIVSDGILADTTDFYVAVQSVNDPPLLELPQSVEFNADTSLILNIWEYADDVETADSLLNYNFSTSNDSLLTEFNTSNGDLTLSVQVGFSGTALLYVSVSDDSGAAVWDSISVIVSPITGISDFPGMENPGDYVLEQNYPNPFNPMTQIRFGLPASSRVKLTIYNIAGQQVAVLVNEEMTAGYHEVLFEATHIASGIYLYHIQAGNFQDVKKMILLK